MKAYPDEEQMKQEAERMQAERLVEGGQGRTQDELMGPALAVALCIAMAILLAGAAWLVT